MLQISFKGIKANRLKSFVKIIETYLRLNTKLANDWGYEDVPWWYNERANLSVLVGAVWNTGGTAFEEYISEKKNRNKKYYGRNDLFMTYKDRDYIAEAKIIYPNGKDEPKKILKAINDKLIEAVTDVRKNTNMYKNDLLALLFVVPKFKQSKTAFLESDIIHFIQILLKTDYTIIGWSFPKKSRTNPSLESNYQYPGIAIIIKKV